MAIIGQNIPTTSSGGRWVTIPADTKYASGHWQIPPATVTTINGYVRNTSGSTVTARFMVYKGEMTTWQAKYPGELMAVSDDFTVAHGFTGWKSPAIASFETGDDDIWLCIHTDSGNTTSGLEINRWDHTSGWTVYDASDGADAFTGGPTDPFPTGAYTSLREASEQFTMYLDYTSTEGITRSAIHVGASTNDGFVYKQSAAWPPGGSAIAHTTSSSDQLAGEDGCWAQYMVGTNADIQGDNVPVGQYRHGQWIMRFDTSGIPDDATITRAIFRFDMTGNHQQGAQEDMIHGLEWVTDDGSISTADYADPAAYSSSSYEFVGTIRGAHRAWHGLTNLNLINKTGYTKLRGWLKTSTSATSEYRWSVGGTNWGGGSYLIVDYYIPTGLELDLQPGTTLRLT